MPSIAAAYRIVHKLAGAKDGRRLMAGSAGCAWRRRRLEFGEVADPCRGRPAAPLITGLR
jgi:hypothetical protein